MLIKEWIGPHPYSLGTGICILLNLEAVIFQKEQLVEQETFPVLYFSTKATNPTGLSL